AEEDRVGGHGPEIFQALGQSILEIAEAYRTYRGQPARRLSWQDDVDMGHRGPPEHAGSSGAGRPVLGAAPTPRPQTPLTPRGHVEPRPAKAVFSRNYRACDRACRGQLQRERSFGESQR